MNLKKNETGLDTIPLESVSPGHDTAYFIADPDGEAARSCLVIARCLPDNAAAFCIKLANPKPDHIRSYLDSDEATRKRLNATLFASSINPPLRIMPESPLEIAVPESPNEVGHLILALINNQSQTNLMSEYDRLITAQLRASPDLN